MKTNHILFGRVAGLCLMSLGAFDAPAAAKSKEPVYQDVPGTTSPVLPGTNQMPPVTSPPPVTPAPVEAPAKPTPPAGGMPAPLPTPPLEETQRKTLYSFP